MCSPTMSRSRARCCWPIVIDSFVAFLEHSSISANTSEGKVVGLLATSFIEIRHMVRDETLCQWVCCNYKICLVIGFLMMHKLSPFCRIPASKDAQKECQRLCSIILYSTKAFNAARQ